MKIGAIDLFCGIGGLTNGLQQAGIRVLAGFDIDPACRFAYETNNSTPFIEKDINKITAREIKHIFEGMDFRILVGCAPCQPFSSHRKDKKNRKAHKDWSLLYQFSRLVCECEPDVVSMENVPAIIREDVFLDFVSTLEKLEYKVNYSIVNVADYGVAQRRRRLILIASKKQNVNIIPQRNINGHLTVRDAIFDLPELVAGEICADDILHRAPNLSVKNMKRIQASTPNGNWREWPEELLLNCHKKQTGKTYSSVYGRMAWDDIAPTITTQFFSFGTGRFGHPEQNRALSLREGAILQSFPAHYRFVDENHSIVFKTVAKHIGNAVPPVLGRVVGESILFSINNQLGGTTVEGI